MANAFRTNIPLPVWAIGITAVCRVASVAHDDATYKQMCAIFVRSGHEPQTSNVALPKLLPLGNAHTSMTFLSLTRNSGSTACNYGSTVSTPSPCGTSPISFHSQEQKRLLYGLQRQKSIFLLLCVAEQYRGAVELCETEGLK